MLPPAVDASAVSTVRGVTPLLRQDRPDATSGVPARNPPILPPEPLALGRRPPRRLLTYGLAVLVSLVALGVSYALNAMVEHSPFALFLGAVTLSAWRGGLGPGLLATLIAAVAINAVAEGPAFTLGPATANAAIDLLTFLLVALLISSLNAHLREARRRAEHSKREAEVARAVAEEAACIRENILASVAHDLRSPLTVVSGQAELLLRRLAGGRQFDSAVLEAGLARIVATANRMRTDIDELVDVARLRAGGPVGLRLGPTDLVTIARRVMAAHEDTPDAGRIRLDAQGEPLVGVWDAARLERALENLVDNALKYSPAVGDVRISIGRQEEADAAWAVVRVQDQGVGIPDEDLPRVFEPFQRARNVEGRIRGSGVGLASVRHIVHEHGGRISVESREGAGSTFVVCLPLGSRPASLMAERTIVQGPAAGAGS
jgi:signal transduction histidine kinase